MILVKRWEFSKTENATADRGDTLHRAEFNLFAESDCKINFLNHYLSFFANKSIQSNGVHRIGLEAYSGSSKGVLEFFWKQSYSRFFGLRGHSKSWQVAKSICSSIGQELHVGGKI